MSEAPASSDVVDPWTPSRKTAAERRQVLESDAEKLSDEELVDELKAMGCSGDFCRKDIPPDQRRHALIVLYAQLKR